MTGRVKSFETDVEALKAACVVIDCMLADIKRDYSQLDEEHFKLITNYKILSDLAKKRRALKGEPRRRYLTQEELAIFTQPASGGSSEDDLVIDEIGLGEKAGSTVPAASTSSNRTKK